MNAHHTLRALHALVLGTALAVAVPAQATDEHGHDHGEAPAAANASGPQRLPDGSVFLPKPAQRQIGVRTLLAATAPLARTTELSAKVTMDPNAGGKVQSTVAGRIEPGARGLPTVGQAVRRGEVLAYVVPSASAIERSGQAAQVAELRAARALANKRVARLRDLADTVPRKDIEAAESEMASLGARIGALGTGLTGREALVAPVSGVIAAASVVAGQVVDAREAIYDIVDPSRLTIEALAFDAAVAADVGSAVLAVGKDRVPLRFVGAGRTLREQALPLVFKAEGAALSALAIGQAVKVYVQSAAKRDGIAVPAAALMKNAANQAIVWVKTDPERFEARTVTVEPLDGVSVAVVNGVAAGDRVVTTGATLINQIR